MDTIFELATMRYIEELASLLGPQEVAFISQDDKARVPLGITAANKQAPLLMHVEYRVSLPDHDWVVASKHKLIPSVYAGIEIKEGLLGDRSAVGYSGPKFVAIRSGKHASSTAASHARDLEKLYDVPEFEIIVRSGTDKLPKPVLIITVDGGPDESPCYDKVINMGIHHFLKRDLDGLFIACNAPGRSAFNRVERRMAPLGRELAGVILPHDHYGNHLNSKGETIDDELEKNNFARAGETLAEIWNGTVIDHFPTVAEYVPLEKSELNGTVLEKDITWQNTHVTISQYLLQVVKCQNSNCCSPCRSSLFQILRNRVLPMPVPIAQTLDGLKILERGSTDPSKYGTLFVTLVLNVKDMLPRSSKSFKLPPYDLYCPSLQSKISSRVCQVCGKYLPSVAKVKAHYRVLHKNCAAPEPAKERPLRIAARRQRELMTILAYDMNMTDAESGSMKTNWT